MNNLKQEDKEVSHESGSILNARLRRRSFLQYAGAGAAGVALMAAGCSKDNDPSGPEEPPVVPSDETVTFGTGDNAVLNYAYALEQLEAAFYTKVVENFYTGISATEKDYLTDIQLHEIAHREVFRNALGGNAIGRLTFDFSSIDFTKRDSVLKAAMAFEDLGVSAYNGVASLLSNKEYLLLAAKIVSVEARHAAFLREAVEPNSFAKTVVNSAGIETSRKPSDVWSIVAPYVTTKINTSTLPA
jgi:rubrerythrin